MLRELIKKDFCTFGTTQGMVEMAQAKAAPSWAKREKQKAAGWLVQQGCCFR